MILVAGGSRDPNITHFARRLSERGVVHHAVLLGPDEAPRISWDLRDDTLCIDGVRVAPRAVFMRPDVVGAHETGSAAYQFRASAWATTLLGWVAAHPAVECVNRVALDRVTNKLDVLVRARRLGLTIPDTLVSNDAALLGALDGTWIAKPVGGGDLTVSLGAALEGRDVRQGALAAPALVQERLEYPELRVYLVRGVVVAFRLRSPDLDYRREQRVSVEHVPDFASTHPELTTSLLQLASELGLDFAAADLKTSATSLVPVFLEINSMPMFARFDSAAGGLISDALIASLSVREE